MEDKIFITLPGISTNVYLNMTFIRMLHIHENKRRENVVLNGIAGTFDCPWVQDEDGVIQRTNIVEYEACINALTEEGIKPIFVFNIQNLEPSDLDDTVCNLMLSIASDNPEKSCSFVVSSPELKKYIEENYEGLNVILSTDFTNDKFFKIDKLSENNMVIVGVKYNNNFKVLKNFSNPQNLILIPNSLESDDSFGEGMIDDNYYRQCIPKAHYISYKMMIEEYLPRGFCNFLLGDGDCNPSYFIDSFVDYFFKEEYQQEIKSDILTEIIDTSLNIIMNPDNQNDKHIISVTD